MVAFADTFLKEIVEGDFVVNFVRICITGRGKNICRIAVALRPFGERSSLVKVFEEIFFYDFTSSLVVAIVRLRTIMRLT